MQLHIKALKLQLRSFQKIHILKFFICLIMSSDSSIGHGQSINFGDSCTYVKAIIEYSTRMSTGYDTYGHSKGNNVIYDVKYFNGRITAVSQCYSNQYILMYRKFATFCQDYNMVNGKLDNMITQYQDISVEELTGFYNQDASFIGFDNYFFTENFQKVSKVYLAVNGFASVDYRITNWNNIPYNIKKKVEKYKQDEIQKRIEVNQTQELERKKEELEQEERERIRLVEEEERKKIQLIEEEEKRQREAEIVKKTFNILDCKDIDITKVKKDLSQQINYNCKQYESIPNFEAIRSKKIKYYHFSNSYYLYLNSNKSTYLETQYYNLKPKSKKDSFSLLNGNDSLCEFIKFCKLQIPVSNYQKYEVNTYAIFDSLHVDFYKGITKVRVKKGKVKYKNNAPPAVVRNYMNSRLVNFNRGSYRIEYSYTATLDNKYCDIQSEEINTFGEKVLKTTGKTIVVAGVLFFLYIL